MAQSLAQLWTHLIFSNKDRFPFLNDKKLRADMHAYLAKVLRQQSCETLIVNGVEDHIHALSSLSRTRSLASVVKESKRTSAGFAKDLSPTLAKFHWQNGYGAFSISPAHVDAVTEYIKNQEEHHRGVTFQEEYRRLLKKYGLTFDERYVWD